mmetsp:Transcript_64768/g.163033  ORF Transcript_64768/g.163033 Transcript_64768/m.163033 type:complete len:89 (+) Transcript_64768:2474-2740(+)
MEEDCTNSPRSIFINFCATSASTALNGSSNNKMSAFAYTARARDTRCFCPPDRFTPFSPISVASPLGRASMSGSNWHAFTTLLYRSSS